VGANFWASGSAPNRTALEAIFQYSHEAGLAEGRLKVEELFHLSTLELADAA